MGAKAPKIYIITPDANLATMRRLRGIGVTQGIDIHAVPLVTELPQDPDPSSILVIPESQFKKLNKPTSWNKILVASMGPQTQPLGNSHQIIVNVANESVFPYSALLDSVIYATGATAHIAPWHSVTHHGQVEAINLVQEISRWTKIHKIQAHGSIIALMKNLGTAAKISIASKSSAMAYEISFDSQEVRINLHINCLSASLQDDIKDLTARPNFGFTCIKLQDSAITYFSKIRIKRASDCNVLLIIDHQADAKESPASNREAS